MLDLEDSDGAIVAAKDACSLDAYRLYCLVYATRLLTTGETAAARSLYTEILQKLYEAEHPDPDPLFRARTLMALSATTTGPDANSEAKRLLEQAKATLHDAHPNNEDDRTRLLAAILDLTASRQYHFDSQLSPAVQTYNQSLALYERLALKYPRTYRAMVAQELHGLASVYLELGKRQVAEKALRRGLEIYETTARTDPGAGASGWARTASDYSGFLTERQPDESERVYQRTVQILRAVQRSRQPFLCDAQSRRARR